MLEVQTTLSGFALSLESCSWLRAKPVKMGNEFIRGGRICKSVYIDLWLEQLLRRYLVRV